MLGLADALRRFGFLVFGPSAAAARIEGSKAFAKEVMAAAAVPAAGRLPIARPPCVIKADGLAAGKGVFVCRTQAEVDEALRCARAGSAGDCRGRGAPRGSRGVALRDLRRSRARYRSCSAQDFKRAFDGDEGPNTGGMGAYAPVPGCRRRRRSAMLDLHDPRARSRRARDAVARPFVGLLYAGLMLTAGRAARPRVQLPVRRSRDAGSAAACSRPTSLTALARGGARRHEPGSRSRSRTALRSRSCSRRSVTPKRRSRRGDHRHRGGGGGRGAGLPRRNRAPRRPARDERWTDPRPSPGSAATVADARAAAYRGVELIDVPGHAPAFGHRRSRGGEHSGGAYSGQPLVTRRADTAARASVTEATAGRPTRIASVIARYARPAMTRVWSDEEKLERWLAVELAALDAWAQVGTVTGEQRACRPRACPCAQPRACCRPRADHESRPRRLRRRGLVGAAAGRSLDYHSASPRRTFSTPRLRSRCRTRER